MHSMALYGGLEPFHSWSDWWEQYCETIIFWGQMKLSWIPNTNIILSNGGLQTNFESFISK